MATRIKGKKQPEEPTRKIAVVELEIEKVEIPPYKKLGRDDLFEGDVKVKLADLMADIERNGLLHPIVVRMVDGKCLLVAGLRRLLAFKALERPEFAKIPAITCIVSEKNAPKLTYSENARRKSASFAEICGIATLLSETGMNSEEIAGELGEPSSTIRSALNIWERLISEARMALSKSIITRDEATSISNLPESAQLKALQNLHTDKGKTNLPRAEKTAQRNQAIANAAKEDGVEIKKRPTLSYCKNAASKLFEMAKQAEPTDEKKALICRCMAEIYLVCAGDRDPKEVYAKFIPGAEAEINKPVEKPKSVEKPKPVEKPKTSVPSFSGKRLIKGK